jgi:apolipoprotein N-acyltransferase
MITPPATPADDAYAKPPPARWARFPNLFWIGATFACTAFLLFAAFPPLDVGQAAYVALIPGVLWAYRRPALRLYAPVVLGAQVVAWIALLWWVHHVTWVGMLALGAFVGLLTGLWYLAVWWAVPRLTGQHTVFRIVAMLGLAGLWALLEWLRGRLFGGFPWLPFAASQWRQPLVLQVASYAGTAASSALLVFFNLGAAAYVHRIFFEGARGLRKRSPEFVLALGMLALLSVPFLTEVLGQRRHRLARVAFVQPYVPQVLKWDPAQARDILQRLEKLTLDANDAGAPDFIVWPEASTPWILKADPNVAAWLASLSHRTGKPLLVGCVAAENVGRPDERWTNGAFLVDPNRGVLPDAYAKRHLVPFGEYVPLRSALGWLQKFVPIGGDFTPGDSDRPLVVRGVPVGVLICYEDIFPELARDNAGSGAELLAVLTNNAWYGEGGAAYQHAAHSVLRAIETRRPVLRCGNGGWSGWIDEFGHIRATLTDENQSIYYRGYATHTVTRDLRWAGRASYYSIHGDWFLLPCALLAVGAFYVCYTARMQPLPSRDDEADERGSPLPF